MKVWWRTRHNFFLLKIGILEIAVQYTCTQLVNWPVCTVNIRPFSHWPMTVNNINIQANYIFLFNHYVCNAPGCELLLMKPSTDMIKRWVGWLCEWLCEWLTWWWRDFFNRYAFGPHDRVLTFCILTPHFLWQILRILHFKDTFCCRCIVSTPFL